MAEERVRTRDLGGCATTAEMAEAMREKVLTAA